MNNNINYFKKITNDVYAICSNDVFFEDKKSVMGAKTSRELHVENKWDLTDENVVNFLERNVLNYGHASIGDMSNISVFQRGFGWIAAWFFEDDPLFNGQEVSTRAVDLVNQGLCYDSINIIDKEIYTVFKNNFLFLKQKLQSKTGYKFDNIRWTMPGSFQTGVSIFMTARSFIRHMNRLENIVFIKPFVDNYIQASQWCSPTIIKSLTKNRNPLERWSKPITILEDSFMKNVFINITPPNDLQKKLDDFLHKKHIRLEYITDEINVLGHFKVDIKCSLACARDFHRHRSVMPWTIKLLTQNNITFIHELYNQYINTGFPIDQLMKKCHEYFIKNNCFWQYLYIFPMGTTIQLTCHTTLNFLIYMLELRYNSKGSNFEYKTIAFQGIQQLKKILNKHYSKFGILE